MPSSVAAHLADMRAPVFAPDVFRPGASCWRVWAWHDTQVRNTVQVRQEEKLRMLGRRVPEFLPYLTVAGPVVVILAIVYRAFKGLSLLLAVIVGICTRDENRRDACVEMVCALCQVWSRRSRSPAPSTLPTPTRRASDTRQIPPSLPPTQPSR